MTSLLRPAYIEDERPTSVVAMLDLFYIVLPLLFFAVCWFFTKACDRL